MRVEVSERIEYIEGQENPISSEVVIVKGDNATWIYDVGTSDEAFDAISELILDMDSGRDVNIVISHFHKDHMGNLDRIAKIPVTGKCVNLYVSSYTYERSKTGIIVDNDITIDDGVKIHIFKMPSTHSKGCLCMEAGGEVVCVGDAVFPAYKKLENEKTGEMSACVDVFVNKDDYKHQYKVYNVQHLKNQIDMLNSIESTKIFMSHEKRPIAKKAVIVKFLESIYAKREQNNPLILIGEGRCIF